MFLYQQRDLQMYEVTHNDALGMYTCTFEDHKEALAYYYDVLPTSFDAQIFDRGEGAWDEE
jgi:hypothetical protein